MATDEQRQQITMATKLDLDATSASYLRENIARISKDHGIKLAREDMITGDFKRYEFEVNNKWS